MEAQRSKDPLVIAHRYEVIECLAKGREVEVHRVRDRLDPSLDLVLKRATGRSPVSERARRLETEFRILADLRHPHLPRAYDFGYDIPGRFSYLAMDRMGGVPAGQGSLRADEIRRLVIDICRALSLLHGRNLLHLDVKPGNILWDASRRRASLIDFDLATWPEGGRGRGTLPYAAPEVLEGRVAPDARADLFSLGVTLHELVGGNLLGEEIVHVGLDPGPSIDVDLRDLVCVLTQESPADRPENARAVIARLLSESAPLESPSTRAAVLGRPPLLARKDELDHLIEVHPPASDRQLKHPVAVISGSAGTGKSRLAEALSIEWRTGGLRVVDVSAGAASGTLGPVRRLLERLQRLEGTYANTTFKDLLGPRGPGDWLGAFDRIAQRIISLASSRKTLLLLEDVHRYDPTSRAFLLHFLRRIAYEADESRAPLRTAVLITVDGEVVLDDPLKDFFQTEASAERLALVELPPLTRAETRELIRETVTPERIPPWLVDFAHDVTGGNPMMLVELLQSATKGTAEHPLLGILAEQRPDESDVPRTVHDLAEKRLARLDPPRREWLEHLAVLPKPAGALTLARIETETGLLRSTLDVLERSGLILRDGHQTQIRDRTLRGHILGALDSERRVALHDAAGARLDPGAFAERAYHRLLGSDPLGGLDECYAIFPDLLERGEEEEALLLLEETSHLGELSPFAARWASLQLSAIYLGRGATRQARQHVENVLAMGNPATDVPAVRALARVLAREGDAEGARERLVNTLARMGKLAVDDRLAVILDLAELLLSFGRFSEAFPYLEQGRDLLGRSSSVGTFFGPAPESHELKVEVQDNGADVASVGRLLAILAEGFLDTRDWSRGLRCALAVMRLTSRVGDLRGLGASLHAIGRAYLGLERLDLSEHHFVRALNLRRQLGDLEGVSASSNNLGILFRRSGRTGTALEHFRTTLRIAQQIGESARETAAYLNIANIHLSRLELDRASNYYRKALAVCRRHGHSKGEPGILNNLGVVAHLKDRFTEAIQCYGEAAALDRSAGNLSGARRKGINLAHEYTRVGMLDEASSELDHVLAEYVMGSDPSFDAEVLKTRGKVESARGDFDTAALTFQEAERALRDLGLPDTDPRLDRAQTLVDSGRAAEALSVLPEVDRERADEAAKIAVIKAQAFLCMGGRDPVRLIAELEEGERFARQTGLPGLLLDLSTARGAVHVRMNDDVAAHGAFARALEALETIAFGIEGQAVLEHFLETPRVRRYRSEVKRWVDDLRVGVPRKMSQAAEPIFMRLRDALFDAERRLGPAGETGRSDAAIRRILQVTRALRSTAPLDELLREVVDEMVAFSRAERGFLITLDGKGFPQVRLARDSNREGIHDPEKQVSRKIISEVERTQKSIRLRNARSEAGSAESVMNLDLLSVMCSPLIHGGQVIGMLYVDNRAHAGQFSAQDLELLDIFSAQAASALENARLMREFARDEKIRVLGNLARGVAHEFNNLMTTVLMGAQNLAVGRDDAELLRGLSMIEQAARDGRVVVERIQELTRRRKDQDFAEIDVASLLDDVIAYTRHRWESEALRQGIQILVSVDVPKGLRVLGNAAELREVFMNLVLNGIEAMPEGGRLELEAQLVEDKVSITVRDTGIGMSEEVRANIFDPYYTTRGDEGSGLGLSIANGIVLRHEGTIHVTSTPGQGALVEVVLKAGDMSGVVPDLPTAALRLPRVISGRRVLVVDDEASVCEVLRGTLERHGLVVETAEDGPTAVSLLSRFRPDLVMTDLGMRPLNGWAVAEAVKRWEPSTGVVLITGWGAEIEPGKEQDRHVDAVIGKPFEIEKVIEVVTDCLFRDLKGRGEAAAS